MKKNNLKIKNHKADIFSLVLFLIIATALTIVYKTNFLTSTLLFFGFPSLYLSFKNKNIIRKSILFSLLFSIPVTIIVDYIAVLDKSWFVPITVFGSRLFGVIPYEDFIWMFFFVYLIVMFYEYFLDGGKKEDNLSKNIKLMITIFSFLLVMFFILLMFIPDLLYIEYFYLKAGIIAVLIPLFFILAFFRTLRKKFFISIIYFMPLFLFFELTGLYNNQWEFSGENFIGFIGVFGLRFPIEELVFWIILGSIWILSYYEYFADDRT